MTSPPDESCAKEKRTVKLPNRKYAFVDRSKLENYLLSESHAVGRTKARFFRKFGFDDKTIDLLERGLIKIAQNHEITEATSSPHGEKYIIDGTLPTPFGSVLRIRTVWIIDKGRKKPRFVTAYPLDS